MYLGTPATTIGVGAGSDRQSHILSGGPTMNTLWTLAAVALLGSVLLAGVDKERTFRFAKADAGKVPAGWMADQTGKGEGSVWKVVADETAPSKTGHVLAQTAASP